MKNFARKISKDKKGFSLTEVLIGMMILTIAIVSATNLLVSLVRTNRINVNTLQAHYLAQEGIEAIRNIRDSNWLLNLDFRGDGNVYPKLTEGTTYAVSLSSSGWANSKKNSVNTQTELAGYAGWDIEPVSSSDSFDQRFALVIDEQQLGSHFYSNGPASEATFFRHVEILPACEDEEAQAEPERCEESIMIRSVVSWRDGGDEKDVTLETILTNWKGGAV